MLARATPHYRLPSLSPYAPFGFFHRPSFFPRNCEHAFDSCSPSFYLSCLHFLLTATAFFAPGVFRATSSSSSYLYLFRSVGCAKGGSCTCYSSLRQPVISDRRSVFEDYFMRPIFGHRFFSSTSTTLSTLPIYPTFVPRSLVDDKKSMRQVRDFFPGSVSSITPVTFLLITTSVVPPTAIISCVISPLQGRVDPTTGSWQAIARKEIFLGETCAGSRKTEEK